MYLALRKAYSPLSCIVLCPRTVCCQAAGAPWQPVHASSQPHATCLVPPSGLARPHLWGLPVLVGCALLCHTVLCWLRPYPFHPPGPGGRRHDHSPAFKQPQRLVNPNPGVHFFPRRCRQASTLSFLLQWLRTIEGAAFTTPRAGRSGRAGPCEPTSAPSGLQTWEGGVNPRNRASGPCSGADHCSLSGQQASFLHNQALEVPAGAIHTLHPSFPCQCRRDTSRSRRPHHRPSLLGV